MKYSKYVFESVWHECAAIDDDDLVLMDEELDGEE